MAKNPKEQTSEVENPEVEEQEVEQEQEAPQETAQAQSEPASTTSPKPKRGAKCVKSYLQPEGDPTRHATPETVGLRFSFADNVDVDVTRENIGDGCLTAAMWHGLAQKLGDSYAGSKDPTDAREGEGNFMAVLELLQADEWVRERQAAGPRPSMILDAVCAALVAKGEEVSDERRAAAQEKLKDADFRKATLENPAVKAEYARIRAENAARQATKALEVSKASEETISGF